MPRWLLQPAPPPCPCNPPPPDRKTGIHSLVCLGGFRNLRQEYAWEGLTLELDETFFKQGTLYEIECETVGGEGVECQTVGVKRCGDCVPRPLSYWWAARGPACVYSLPPLAPFPSPLTRVHMPHKSPLLPSPPPLQDQPQAVRDKLEALLNSQSIPFSYSKVSKFANFIKKSLL